MGLVSALLVACIVAAIAVPMVISITDAESETTTTTSKKRLSYREII
jgi:hypothetical protein